MGPTYAYCSFQYVQFFETYTLWAIEKTRIYIYFHAEFDARVWFMSG